MWLGVRIEYLVSLVSNNSLHPTTGPVTPRACARPAPDPVAGEPRCYMNQEWMRLVKHFKAPSLAAFLFVVLWALPGCASEVDPCSEGFVEPVPIYQEKSEYPEYARRAQIEGIVVVRAQVDKAGIVVSTELVESVHELLDNAALEAAAMWVFEPAREDCRSVESFTAIPFNFRLH